MEILPPTGGSPGNPWYFAVRDGKEYLFDVVDYDRERGYKRARDLVRKLEIAETAIKYFDEVCAENGRCVPNCPITDSGHKHQRDNEECSVFGVEDEG